jgi:polyhydroxybutyrate depolymerase
MSARRLVAAAALATALAALTGSPPAAAATPGCTLASTGGTITRALGTRTYELNVPAGLTGAQVPLLLSLHGAGSNGSQDESFTGWSGYAASHDFIVAYPDARPNWGGGVWDPYTAGSADVAFARQVVADISAHWCVDPQRVFSDGWSNGAVMSQRLACDAADLFAAATSYAGGSPTAATFAAPCAPSRPIAVGMIVGQEDFTYGGLSQNVSEWSGYDHCSSSGPTAADAYGSSTTYACADGAQLLARVVSNTSHNWPFGAQAEDQRDRMWSFLMAHPVP